MGELIRAALVAGPGQRPEVTEIELGNLRDDEVLVRIGATGVCHTDVAWADGELFDAFPVVLGHESAGVVDAVGRGVERVRPGDRVVLSLAHHCGHCAHCERGSPMLCARRSMNPPRLSRDGEPIVQGFGTGGLAEAAVVRDVSAIRIPDDVPLQTAAVIGCAVATGFGAVMNIAEVRPGSTTVVLGCGAIGLSVVMGAKVSGSERIVVVDPDAGRRAIAAELGATDAVADAAELGDLQPEGFDYAFEASGHSTVMTQAVRATRRGGTVTLIGAPPPEAILELPAFDFVVSQRRLLGCLTGDVRPNIDVDAYCRLYRRGLLDLDKLVTTTLPLDDVATAFDRSRRGDGIRTIVSAADVS